MPPRIITIDGPAGAGKTTISKALSKRLGCVYVDTGALYRGVAFEITQQQVDSEDDEALETLIQGLKLDYIMAGEGPRLLSSGKDITGLIRTSEISMTASVCSAKPQVRAALLNIQREIAKTHDAVFEGRDMGTVVFPDADHKFYLFADLSVRAKRRYDEMTDVKKDITDVEKQMHTRDKNDSRRQEAPLKPAADAVKIDSTNLTIEQVVGKMMDVIEN